MKLTPIKRKPNSRRGSEDDFPFELLAGMGGSNMLDATHPHIRVIGEFTQEMASEFAQAIGTLRKRGERAALIEIASPGGDLFALFQMLNCMDSSGMTFATYNSSHAYSAGAVLLAAGEKGARFVAELSSTMLHPLSTGIAPQQIEDVVAQSRHDEELNAIMMVRLAKYLGMSRAKLAKELQKPSEGGAATLWLTPERCVELGVADVVGIPTFQTETTLGVVGIAEPSQPTKPKAPRAKK